LAGARRTRSAPPSRRTERPVPCWLRCDGRLLKPKLKKKEVQLGDLIVPVGVDAKQEAAGGDLDLNPVIQAKMVLERWPSGKRRGETALGSGAQGALKRLLKGVGGTLNQTAQQDQKMKKKDKLKQLDRDLANEAKADMATEKKRKDEEADFKKAEKAALAAAKGVV